MKVWPIDPLVPRNMRSWKLLAMGVDVVYQIHSHPHCPLLNASEEGCPLFEGLL